MIAPCGTPPYERPAQQFTESPRSPTTPGTNKVGDLTRCAPLELPEVRLSPLVSWLVGEPDGGMIGPASTRARPCASRTASTATREVNSALGISDAPCYGENVDPSPDVKLANFDRVCTFTPTTLPSRGASLFARILISRREGQLRLANRGIAAA